MRYIERSQSSLLFSLALSGALAISGCANERGGNAPGQSVRVRGTVLDAKTKSPISGALIAIERGGLYVQNPDPSRGNPSYQFGAETDERGAFDLLVPGGTLGLHAFQEGYFYGIKATDATSDTSVEITAAPLTEKDKAPTLSDVRLDPPTVSPGAPTKLRAHVAAATPEDPLSEIVIVVQPAAHWSAALDPPEAGKPGTGFPDGEWTKELVAPTEPGSYRYGVSATTEGCANSGVVFVTLQVRSQPAPGVR